MPALIRHVVRSSSADITSKQQQTRFGIGITCSAADNGKAKARVSVFVNTLGAWSGALIDVTLAVGPSRDAIDD